MSCHQEAERVVTASTTNSQISPRTTRVLMVVIVAAFVIAISVSQPREARAQASASAARPSPGEMMLTGREEYIVHCASCHGLDGRGDGPAASVFKIRPANLTLLSRRNRGVFPAKRVFETIDGTAMVAAHGSREMPVWGEIFERQGSNRYNRAATESEVRERIQRLVDYVKSIQRK
jgi:mono/diheme cytochrome c family protein